MFRSLSLLHKSNRNLIDRVIAEPSDSAPARLKEEIERVIFARQDVERVEWNRRTGAPGFLYGRLAPPMDGDEAGIARQCLRRWSGFLKIEKDLSDLQETNQFEWNGLRHVRFQQTCRGIPVWGAEVLVGIDSDNVARLLASDFDPAAKDFLLAPASAGERISSNEAIERALSDLDGEASGAADGPIPIEMVLYPTLDGYASCYHLLIPKQDPLGDWRYFVDRASGRIQDSSNAMRFVPHTQEIHAGLGSLESVPGTVPGREAAPLQGWIAVRKVPRPASSPSDSGDPRQKGAPEEDEVFCRLAAAEAYKFFQELGFHGFTSSAVPGERSRSTAQLLLNVRAGDRYDNAYFSPATGEISLGEGSYPVNPCGVGNLALEPAVIFHEMGHAVVEELRPAIVGTDGAALHEAVADYFSASFMNTPLPRPRVRLPLGAASLRDLSSAASWARTPREPHLLGLVWSRACWSLRERLGRKTADALVYGTILLLTTSAPTIPYARDRMFLADRVHFGGAHRGLIKDIFDKQCGIPGP